MPFFKQPKMLKGAEFAGDGKHRLSLSRKWDLLKPLAVIIGLNPSTADANYDDPTIKSCIRIAKKLGWGGFYMLNLFTLRATDPDVCKTTKAMDRNHFTCDAVIREWHGLSDLVVCAWGRVPWATPRIVQVKLLLQDLHVKPYCFGRTKEGYPRHPLYLKSDVQLEEYDL